MRKHEINYHEKTSIIEFITRFCTHSKKIKTKMTNKEKKISFEKESFFDQSNHVDDILIKNSRKFFTIVIKVLSRKEINSDQSTINLFRKDKKSIKSVNKTEIFNAVKDFKLNFNELRISNSKEKKSLSAMNIAMIETFAFNMMRKKKNVNLFLIILKDVKKHFEKHSKLNIVIKNVLFSEYHEFFDVFDKKAFNTFVSHNFYDHKIVLKKNVIFDYISLYKMFEKKLKIVKKYFENNLKKKFIVANRSFFALSMMFMKKTNESLKFCVDYRKLNQLIKKNRYSLSLIDETFAHLRKTKYFIKLNIR